MHQNGQSLLLPSRIDVVAAAPPAAAAVSFVLTAIPPPPPYVATKWSFSDGSADATGVPAVTRTFAPLAGDVVVSLTMTAAASASPASSLPAAVIVRAVVPVGRAAGFSAVGRGGEPWAKIRFTLKPQPGVGTATAAPPTWDFGDGTGGASAAADGSSSSVLHAYAAPGVYLATLAETRYSVVCGDDGARREFVLPAVTQAVHVASPISDVALVGGDSVAAVGDTVVFRASSAAAIAPPTRSFWTAAPADAQPQQQLQQVVGRMAAGGEAAPLLPAPVAIDAVSARHAFAAAGGYTVTFRGEWDDSADPTAPPFVATRTVAIVAEEQQQQRTTRGDGGGGPLREGRRRSGGAVVGAPEAQVWSRRSVFALAAFAAVAVAFAGIAVGAAGAPARSTAAATLRHVDAHGRPQ